MVLPPPKLSVPQSREQMSGSSSSTCARRVSGPVGALGEVSISWVPPSENVDGTPLTDLASYRIYYGSMSRSYTDSIDIQDPTATSHAFAVASGDYYVTMTALDQNGNESAYANEIVRSVP